MRGAHQRHGCQKAGDFIAGGKGPAHERVARDAGGVAVAEDGLHDFFIHAARAQDEQGKQARAAMAKLAGTTPEVFEAQLKTTFLYAQAKDAVAATQDPKLIETMTRVRDFSFSKGLFPGASSADAVGMAFPGGKTLGDPAHVTLRFDDSFMKLAADGKL